MADAADTLDIVVKIALDEADRQYEAFKKKVETPLRIPIADASNAATTGRTFTGASVVTGPTNFNTAPSGVGPLTQQFGLQAAIVNRAIGGSGFGPGVGPLPTAAVNSVFGDTSKVLPGGSFAAISEAIAAQSSTAIVRSTRSTDAGNSGTFYRGPGQYGGSRLPELPLMGPIPNGTSEGAFEPSIPIGARGEMNPLSRVQRPIPVRASRVGSGGLSTVGAAVPEIRSSIRGLSVAAAAIMLTDEVGTYFQQGSDRNRYDSVGDAAEAGLSDARGAGFLSRQVARLGNVFSRGTFIDPDQAFDTARQSRGQTRSNQILDDARVSALQTSLIGRSGFGAETAAAQGTFAEESLRLNREAIANGYTNVGPGLAASGNRLRAQLADIGTRVGQDIDGRRGQALISTLSGVNDQFGAGLASINLQNQQQSFQLERDISGLPLSQAEGLRAAERLRAQGAVRSFGQSYVRSATAMTLSLNAQSQGSNLTQGGFGLAGTIVGIQGETQAAMMNAPGFAGYQRGYSNVTAADRERIEAIQRSGASQITAAKNNALANAFGQVGENAAAEQELNFNPFGAQRTRVRAAYSQAVERPGGGIIDIRTGEFRRAAESRRLGMAGVDQAEDLFRIDVGTNLDTEDRVRGRLAARDTVGARAEATAGAGISRARSLFRTDADLGRRARAGTIADLEQQTKDYALSFRAEQTNPYLMAVNNARDAQDPNEVFGAVQAAIRRTESTNLGAGQESGTEKLTPLNVKQAIEDGFTVALGKAVTN